MYDVSFKKNTLSFAIYFQYNLSNKLKTTHFSTYVFLNYFLYFSFNSHLKFAQASIQT